MVNILFYITVVFSSVYVLCALIGAVMFCVDVLRWKSDKTAVPTRDELIDLSLADLNNSKKKGGISDDLHNKLGSVFKRCHNISSNDSDGNNSTDN